MLNPVGTAFVSQLDIDDLIFSFFIYNFLGFFMQVDANMLFGVADVNHVTLWHVRGKLDMAPMSVQRLSSGIESNLIRSCSLW